MDQLIERIAALKKQRNAVILVHNYQAPEVQDIADFLGDSLDLSRKAAETPADVIVFCGVHFMAETAAILSPRKTVLLPDAMSGCPMADMITPEQLRVLKGEHPGAVVVTYVNSSAAVKAETDICCTSSNAVKIVASLPADKEILFVPDRNLGDFVRRRTGRQMVLWNGYCPTHMKIRPEDIAAARERYPGAEVLVHPECMPAVVDMADQVLSTTGVCAYVKASPRTTFIIGTETGIIHRLEKENPGKTFYPAAKAAVCPNMKKNSLDKVLWALEDMRPVISVGEAVRVRAKRAIDRMLELS